MKFHRGIIALITAMVIMVLFAGCISQIDDTGTDAGQDTSAGTVTVDTETPMTTIPKEGSYPVVDTGQVSCYNNEEEIDCPAEGEAFYGQDAQFSDNQPSYTISSDGLTVYDKVTGLTWQKTPDNIGLNW